MLREANQEHDIYLSWPMQFFLGIANEDSQGWGIQKGCLY
jgi:hypothetical protein